MSIYAPPIPSKIHMVPAPCASGKTFATCRHIAKSRYQANWLYVAPSIQLLNQTKAELEGLGLSVDMITSDSHPHGVVHAITRYLKNVEATGQVLLITWTSYQKIPYFNRRKDWRIIIDEVPQVDQFFEINLQQHMDELLEFIQLGESINETLATVIPVDDGKLKRLLERPDDLTKVLLPFFTAVLSPATDVFVDLHSWTQMAERRTFEKQRDANRLYFVAMLNPCLFSRATLLGANLEDSMLYHWFSQYHGVTFCVNQRIAKGLRYTQHPPMGDRLRIQYLLKERGYSKYLANQTLKGSGHRWIDGLDEAALKAINGRPFIYAVNNDYRGRLLDADHGQQIPTISHGLNCYQDYRVIYFSPSLNRSPQHRMMLNRLGLDDGIIKNSTLHEVAYQALMRTALRDLNSTAVVDCIVPEYETAARLASLFGEAQLKWIGDDRFEKKKPMTGTERNQRSKAKKKRRDRLLPPFDDKNPIENSKENCHEKLALLPEGQNDESNPTRPLLYAVTFHATKYDTEDGDFIVDSYTPQEFVREMRSYAKDVVDDKTDNILINPTVFQRVDGSDEGGFRRQANFAQSSLMMLDFDNGMLTIDDFIRLFWTQAGRGNKRSFLIFNSFSRSAEQPNRFRVCLLYKTPATSLEAHQAVYDSVVQRLEQYGYTEETAALDRQCRTGNQSFYMPVTNAQQREWRYFKAFGCTSRDIERHGIDPNQYLRTAVRPVDKVRLIGTDNQTRSLPRRSIEQWKSIIREMTSGRRRILFDFGLALAVEFKLPSEAVSWHLLDVADGNAPMEAKAQGVVESLTRRGHFKQRA